LSLSTPQATIGVRGTDFMVMLTNPSFVSVLRGAIEVRNAAGTATFSAGAMGTVSTAATRAAPIAAATGAGAAGGRGVSAPDAAVADGVASVLSAGGNKITVTINH
jgi:ferric-dicitrate binding protein FerR (iron transport regulator)